MQKHAGWAFPAIMLLGCGGSNTGSPTVSAISPTSGLNSGGEILTITGSGFETGSTVTVGGANCGSVNIVSNTQLTCVAGSAAPQTGASVTVRNRLGRSGTLSGAYEYQLFMYAKSTAPSQIVGYKIDSSTGALTQVSGSFSIAGSPGISNAPGGVFLVNSPGTMNSFLIDHQSGAITPTTSSASTISLPFGLDFDAQGAFAYIGDGSTNQVYGFTVNSSTGAIAAIPGMNPYPFAGSAANIPVTDASGNYLFITDASGSSNNLYTYSVNRTTGAITPLATYSAGNAPIELNFDQSGKYVYVTNSTSHDLSIFSFNSSNGSVTSLGSKSVAAGTPTGTYLHPTLNVLYEIEVIPEQIEVFSIASDGSLTSLQTISSTGFNSLLFDPLGRYVITGNDEAKTLTGYLIDQTTGKLTQGTVNSYAVITNVKDIDDSGKFVVGRNTSAVLVFTMDTSTGTLTQVSSATLNTPAAVRLTTATYHFY